MKRWIRILVVAAWVVLVGAMAYCSIWPVSFSRIGENHGGWATIVGLSVNRAGIEVQWLRLNSSHMVYLPRAEGFADYIVPIFSTDVPGYFVYLPWTWLGAAWGVLTWVVWRWTRVLQGRAFEVEGVVAEGKS